MQHIWPEKCDIFMIIWIYSSENLCLVKKNTDPTQKSLDINGVWILEITCVQFKLESEWRKYGESNCGEFIKQFCSWINESDIIWTGNISWTVSVKQNLIELFQNVNIGYNAHGSDIQRKLAVLMYVDKKLPLKSSALSWHASGTCMCSAVINNVSKVLLEYWRKKRTDTKTNYINIIIFGSKTMFALNSTSNRNSFFCAITIFL